MAAKRSSEAVEGPHVTIVGGGIAGMTAALRLAERDFEVTLYEQKEMLGGNLGSRALGNGPLFDVYPHMYQSWYHNFWQLLTDVGVDRGKNFSEFRSFYQMRRKDESPRLARITDVYSTSHMIENLFSGIVPPADAFVCGYASVDLLAEQANPTTFVENMSLTGFLGTRRYMTKAALEAYETLITGVWAIPGYLISAADCITYLTYCHAEPDEPAWLGRGPAEDVVIKPLAAALKKLKVKVVKNTKITRVICKGDKVSEIVFKTTRWDDDTQTWKAVGADKRKTVDELLLALPMTTLSELVRAGTPGTRIVDAENKLAELALFSCQRIPVVYVAFERKLADVPAEPAGLFASKLNLAVTDISAAWEAPNFQGTVLAASCSEPSALVGDPWQHDALAILSELSQYVDFSAKGEWGESKDIDWARTSYRPNWDARLSLNAIGTDAWRPGASLKNLKNLYLAGDLCQHPFGITTLEAAVATGLAAANEMLKARRRRPFKIEEPKTLPPEVYPLLRYAGLPGAFAAKAWSLPGELSKDKPGGEADGSLLRYLLTPGLRARHRRAGS